MEISLERLAYIVAYMAARHYELVDDIGNDECYLFLGRGQRSLGVDYDEIQCLLGAGVIEVESGCNERGHETIVYCLTEIAIERIKSFISEEKRKRAKNKKLP